MKKNIIKIENLKREFVMGNETVRALKGISFSVEEGEFVTIMGTSGSGKSTLLNILGCLDKPTVGSYEIDNVPVSNLSKNELAHLMYNASVSSRERRERALEALRLVGLSKRIHHTPNQLSGGQQQRVAIARALVNNPVLILADEATGNLDTRTSYEIMALFQELNAKGKTIAFVTHEPDIALFSRRTIVLRDGHITKDYPVENIADAALALAQLPKEEELEANS
jgi:putative ABC transport system ATP-binding protein